MLHVVREPFTKPILKWNANSLVPVSHVTWKSVQRTNGTVENLDEFCQVLCWDTLAMVRLIIAGAEQCRNNSKEHSHEETQTVIYHQKGSLPS